MKKHISGLLILLLTFTVGLLASPIRFDSLGTGHGATKDGGGYWFAPYESTYFVKLIHEGENYNSSERAQEIFKARLAEPLTEVVEQDILDLSEIRAVIFFKKRGNVQGYCSIRVEEKGLRNICSTSLRHVLEFERQKYGN